jgi:putative endopeptidase
VNTRQTAREPITKTGLDLGYASPDIRAQDDLFVHVNERWLAEHEIPADRSADGTFYTMRDRVESDVRKIIESALTAAAEPGTETRKIADLYASFMDTEAVADAGITPIAEELAAVRSAADRTELAALLGRLQRVGVGGALRLYVSTDDKDSTRYLVHFMQSGLGLPDESYYREEKHAEIRAAYVEHIGRMFALAGVADDPAKVFALERRVAEAHWDIVKRREADLGYNPTRFSTLAAENAGFAWSAWSAELAAALPERAEGRFDEVNVRQPDFVVAFARLWGRADGGLAVVADLADHPLPRSVSGAGAGRRELRLLRQHAERRQENRERWKRGVSLVEGLLGRGRRQALRGQALPAGAKARMDELVGNLLEAYRASIATLDWMSPETKSGAGQAGQVHPQDRLPGQVARLLRWRSTATTWSATSPRLAAEHDRDLASSASRSTATSGS